MPKLLLTATPLQNSFLELFGLVSVSDQHAFGDLKSFREQYASLNNNRVFDTLKARLKPLCHRTLRRVVTAYVSFTQRHPLVQRFTPEENEALSETSEEWTEEISEPESLSAADREAIIKELADLESFRNLAVSITHNAKGDALLIALDHAFEEADHLGAARKAIVFTESRRTQEYLLRILSNSPYADGIVLFNGASSNASAVVTAMAKNTMWPWSIS